MTDQVVTYEEYMREQDGPAEFDNRSAMVLAFVDDTPALQQQITNMEDMFLNLAAAEVSEIEGLTEVAKEAITYVYAFKKVNGLDLAALLLRARFIAEIQRRNVIANHPSQYTSLEDMSQDQGVSISQLSQIKDLAFIVFPFLHNIGYNIPILWEDIGKSKFVELVPVIKALIENRTEGGRGAVLTAVNDMIANIFATARSAGQDVNDEAGTVDEVPATVIAIHELIDTARRVPVVELRRHIRPNHTNPLEAYVVQRGDNSLIMIDADSDQLRMLMNVMRNNIEITNADITDPQRDLLRIPAIREIVNMMEGR